MFDFYNSGDMGNALMDPRHKRINIFSEQVNSTLRGYIQWDVS